MKKGVIIGLIAYLLVGLFGCSIREDQTEMSESTLCSDVVGADTVSQNTLNCFEDFLINSDYRSLLACSLLSNGLTVAAFDRINESGDDAVDFICFSFTAHKSDIKYHGERVLDADKMYCEKIVEEGNEINGSLIFTDWFENELHYSRSCYQILETSSGTDVLILVQPSYVLLPSGNVRFYPEEPESNPPTDILGTAPLKFYCFDKKIPTWLFDIPYDDITSEYVLTFGQMELTGADILRTN